MGVSAWRPRGTPFSLLLPLLPVPDLSDFNPLLAVAWFSIPAFGGLCVCMCVYLRVGRGYVATMCWEEIRAQKG